MSTILDKLKTVPKGTGSITLTMNDTKKVAIDHNANTIQMITEQNTSWIHLKNDTEKTEELYNLNLIQSIIIEKQ